MTGAAAVERPHVALLLPDLRGGGAERVTVLLCRRLVELGFRVDLIVLRLSGELLPLVPDQVDVIDLGVRRFRQCIGPLSRHLRSARPDVVLASMWPLTAVAVVAAALARLGRRVVVSDHSILSASPLARTWYRRILLRTSIRLFYRLAMARIAVSNGVAEDVAALGGLVPSTMTVIGNPIASMRLDRSTSEPPPDWGWSAGGKRILSVGSLKAVKDQALLIRAFAQVRPHVDASLVILGEGDLRPDLERLVDELGLRESVRLPGFVLDPSPWYAASDLFVLSSRNEGFGNVIVESLQHGTPVVSTDCHSGPREILANGQFGRLVPVGDAAALAAAMIEQLRAPLDAAMLRRRAAEFSLDAITERYLRVLFPGASTAATVEAAP